MIFTHCTHTKCDILRRYALVVGADWLQGVFVSKIYQCYGYNETARSRFFIAGEHDDHGGGVAGR